MNLEELKKKLESSVAFAPDEFEKVVTESKTEIQEYGITGDKAEKMLVNMVFSKYRKQLSDNSELLEGIVIALGDVTDFGTKKKYDEAMTAWNNADEDIRNVLVERGEFSPEGQPLWNKENTKQEWRYKDKDGNTKSVKERIMNPDLEKQRQGIAIMKKVNGDDKTARVCYITLRHNKLDITCPMFKVVTCKFNVGEDDDKTCYYLRSTNSTSFVAKTDEKISYEELEQLCHQYLKSVTVDMMEDGSNKVKTLTQEKIVVIKNVTPHRCTITEKRSNVMEISEMDINAEPITCWVPKHLPLPAEGFDGVVVIGRANENDGRLFVQVLGLYNTIELEQPKAIPNPEEKDEPWGG